MHSRKAVTVWNSQNARVASKCDTRCTSKVQSVRAAFVTVFGRCCERAVLCNVSSNWSATEKTNASPRQRTGFSSIDSNWTRHAFARISFGSILVQSDQYDTYWRAKQLISLFAVLKCSVAPVESCQSVVQRSLWGRLGSVLDVDNRLHRIRWRLDHIYQFSQQSS